MRWILVPLLFLLTVAVSLGPAPARSAAAECSSAQHASWTTTGPDGATYPTWHPATDPSGCTYGHEHGAWPGNCLANTSWPPFGYANAVAAQPEPHTGFKVLCINTGQVTDDGSISPASYRLVVHMGTSGIGRYSQPFHSVQYDYVANDGTGRYAHIYGMADFGSNAIVGSTCDVPRQGGRDFSTLGCNDAYEIWSGGLFQIKDPADQYQGVHEARASFMIQPAAFDPITTRDPNNPTQTIYTCQVRQDPTGAYCADPLSPSAWYQGCRREFYGGPNFFVGAGKPSIYYTDAYGWVQPGPGTGRIRQEAASVDNVSNNQVKLRRDYCGGSIHSPN